MLEPERAPVDGGPRRGWCAGRVDGRRTGAQSPRARHRRRPRYPSTAARAARSARLRRDVGVERRRRHRAAARDASGSRVPRRRDVGHDRHRRARLHPLAAARCRRDSDHRLQLGAGRDCGAAAWRRRLSAQAVRSRRVSGRARSHAGAAAHEPSDSHAEPRARGASSGSSPRSSPAPRPCSPISCPASTRRWRASRSARAACRRRPWAATSTTGSSCRSAACA